jgi:hypothetical protein
MLGMMKPKMKLPNLKTYKTEANVRKVHLNVINKKVINETIFAKKGICEDTLNVSLDESELEQLFANKEIKKKEEKKVEEKISLLDPKVC